MAELLVVVLAGGTSSRLGRDKLAEQVAGVRLLDRSLGAAAGLGEEGDSVELVAVGPSRATTVPVRWVQEDPAYGGPLLAISAGMGARTREPEVVLVLAGDLPFATGVPKVLLDALRTTGHEAVVAVDPEGREQPLLAAYRFTALSSALDRLGMLANRPMKLLLAELEWQPLVVSARAARDCDNEQDLVWIREQAHDGAR